LKFDERDSCYSFRELNELFDESKEEKVINGMVKQYAELTKKWTKEINSEWACRIYFATNMILNATVLLKNAEFAEEKNFRIVRPYLEYYATLSLLRCVVYTLPTLDWNNGTLIQISHSKAINLVSDWLAKINLKESENLKSMFRLLKAQRELISYRAPASGDSNLKTDYDIIKICTILAEIAQFNSEILESSVGKNAKPDTFVVYGKDIEKITSVTIEGFTYRDRYDRSRLDYIRRKQPRPYNLALFMTEGQTEDFIGAWDADDSDEADIYCSGSPCTWQDIFDIP
jgi:hypothetical protein